MSPRFTKVLRDLWINRKRVLLSVLSIAIGVFAVGALSHMYLIVSRDIITSYNSTNPPDIVINTIETFPQDMVDSTARMSEVEAVQGWRSLNYQYQLPGKDTWHSITLNSTTNMADLKVNKVFPEQYFNPDPVSWPNPGLWPPPSRQIILERSSLLTPNMGLAPDAKKGGTLVLKINENKERELPLAGLAADMGRYPSTFSNAANGYITMDTVEWLGEGRGYDELRVITNVQPHTYENISLVANKLKSKVERSGYHVSTMIINRPNTPPLSQMVSSVVLLMGVLGLIAIPLSGFLVINTISSFINQQIRQIGVMKAVGATSKQIAGLYLGMVLLFGVLAVLVAAPLAVLAARRFIDFLAYFANFNTGTFYLPIEVVVLELAIGLLVPLLAALQPVMKGAHITIREAISSYGLAQAAKSRGLVDRLVEKIHFFSRPVLLSLRNTFRRKARLLLTVITLTLASAVFIAVISVRQSLLLTLDDVMKFYGFDIQIQLNQSYRTDRLKDAVADVPGIDKMEGWGVQGVSRIRPDGSETTEIMLLQAMPSDTTMLNPVLTAGRWLLPEDENAVVVSPTFLNKEKDVKVGDQITLNFNTHKTSWTVVGVANMVDSNQAIVFANYEYFMKIVNDYGKGRWLMLSVSPDDGATQDRVLKEATNRLEAQGFKVSNTYTKEQNRLQNIQLFNILTVLMGFMALLLALVGGLGLMGLMSINVLERTREIGVMRAIGATSRSILSIFMTEGLLVGGMSWGFGVLASIPLSRFLSDNIGMLFLSAKLSFSYSASGALIWLVMVMLIAAVSTWMPAREASRLAVKDVLAYE